MVNIIGNWITGIIRVRAGTTPNMLLWDDSIQLLWDDSTELDWDG